MEEGQEWGIRSLRSFSLGLRTTGPCRTFIAPVKQEVLFTRPTHSGQCLLKLQALETNYTRSL